MERKLSRMLMGIAAVAMVAGCSTGPNQSSGAVSFSSATKVGRFDAQFKRSSYRVVHFGFDQDLLTATAIAKLDSQAAWIMAHPDLKFSVTGHTDKVGNQAYNFDLGMRRAQRVLAYLVAKGIDPDRLMAMVSMGEDDPVIDTEDRALGNRRVVTEVMGVIPRAGGSANTDGDGGTGGSGDQNSDGNGGGQGGNNGNGGQGGNNGNGGNNNNSSQSSSNPSNNRSDAGRGNGAEAGDPGNSGGHNNGGDAD